MDFIEAMAMEYRHEAEQTRKVLERIPEDKLDWKPHEKSMTLGRLASHLAEIQGWAKPTIEQDVMDIPPEFKPLDAGSKEEIMKTFDANMADASAAFSKSLSNDNLMAPWKLTRGGTTMIEMPRAQVLRGFILSHQIHHRGQLEVYLRLLDVPLPAIYGPSADEQG